MGLERLEKTWDEKSKLFEDEITLLKKSKQCPAPKVAVADQALGKELAQSNHANITLQKSSKASDSVTISSSPPHQPRQNQPSSMPNQLK